LAAPTPDVGAAKSFATLNPEVLERSMNLAMTLQDEAVFEDAAQGLTSTRH
jgi:hypothetical protein